MILTSTNLERWNRVVAASQADFDKEFSEATRAEAERAVKVMSFWRPVLLLTIGSGLVGAETLLYSFIRQLGFS